MVIRYGGSKLLGKGPNTVSESTVSNTELSEFLGPHRVPGRELSQFTSAYYLCATANSPSFPRTHRVCPKLRLTAETVLEKQYSAPFLITSVSSLNPLV